MSNKYITLKVLAAPFFLELLAGQIFAAGAQGIQEHENEFIIFFDPANWNQDVFLFLRKLFTEHIPDFDESRMVVESLDAQNWLEKWKKSFKPFRIGERLIIIPDWLEYVPKGHEMILKIAPKMAFGTGHHETTRLCLSLLEKWYRPEMHLLDAGTGSGILSIFAAKLGGTSIVGIDHDVQAVENARENAQLNRVAEQVQFKVEDVTELKSGRYDCVVANINRNVLLQIAEPLTKVVTPDGLLILSGLLRSDQELVENAYLAQGLQIAEVASLNEWLALVFKKEM